MAPHCCNVHVLLLWPINFLLCHLYYSSDVVSHPDDIILAIAKVIRDVAAAHLLQGVEVQLVDPLLLDELSEQVPHHRRFSEETLIAVVVIRHGLSFYRVLEPLTSFEGRDSRRRDL